MYCQWPQTLLFMFKVNVLKYNVIPFYPNFKGLSEDGSDSCYCVLVTMYILLTVALSTLTPEYKEN